MQPFLSPLQEDQLTAVSGIINAAAGVIGGVVASVGLALIVGNGAGSFAGGSNSAAGAA